jgi:ABC-type nickel/cobalt efflux system permease component RcnA
VHATHRLFALFALAVLAAVILAVALPARQAAAHPLGNFTINHYTRIDVTAQGIEVFRVLDMAEIPAFQERQQIDADGDGNVSADESAAYARTAASALANGMSLTVAGSEVELAPVNQSVTFPEGQADLRTLRLEVTYAAPLPRDVLASAASVEYEDGNYRDRIGWREVVVRGGPGVELGASADALVDVSNELRSYPEDQLASPLDVRSVSFSISPGQGAPLPAGTNDQADATRGNPDATLGRFSDLIARDDLTFPVVVGALLLAVGFGAIHALSPGHGKTIVAAYLVGSRGTAKHALLLGLTVTLTHTSSVYVLGFVTLYLSQYILPEELYPWLGVASGAIVLAMGAALLLSRVRSSGLAGDAARWLSQHAPRLRRAERALAAETGALSIARTAPTSHQHVRSDAHEHSHSHDAPHDHGLAKHSHRIPGQDGEPVTWRSLVGLGVFGGMIPCPSAIVVMLSAIALHRVGFGLLLIVAFSVGLAGVLTGIGFAIVYARAIGERLPLARRIAVRAQQSGFGAFAIRMFPVAAATAVVAAGAVITLRALAQVSA